MWRNNKLIFKDMFWLKKYLSLQLMTYFFKNHNSNNYVKIKMTDI